eukprot:153574-Chlamydomonas_euryale.AAC.2
MDRERGRAWQGPVKRCCHHRRPGREAAACAAGRAHSGFAVDRLWYRVHDQVALRLARVAPPA